MATSCNHPNAGGYRRRSKSGTCQIPEMYSMTIVRVRAQPRLAHTPHTRIGISKAIRAIGVHAPDRAIVSLDEKN